MKQFLVIFALGLVSLTACGSDDGGGGSGGSSSGGAAGSGGSATGGAAGSGGSATGGAAGSGGSATGGAAGSGGSATGGASGSGGSATGGTGGTGATSGCNTLVNDGADVPETAQTGTPPSMTGGTIADGTYVLTARKDWQGSCNCTTRQKLAVASGAVQLVTRTDAGADQRMTASSTLAGNKLTLDISCPGTQTKQLEYTATATELSIFDAADQSLNVYTKQ